MHNLEIVARWRQLHKQGDLPKLSHQSGEKLDKEKHQLNMMGVMSEYAVAKYLKIPFDMFTYLGGDGGVRDLVLGEWEIQVKSTERDDGNLVFKSKSSVKALINIMCHVDRKVNVVQIIGYINHNDALLKGRVRKSKKGSFFVIPRMHLKPIANLVYYYNEWMLK